MGKKPCCAKKGLNRGAWSAMEDKILTDYITLNGEGQWRNLPPRAGLSRCGKSCRLRWLNYLRPDIKRGNVTDEEEDLIIRLHKLLGNRWSLIAGRLPGRTDNEIKNYWRTAISKKLVPSSTSHCKKSNRLKEKSMETLIQRSSIGHPSPLVGSCMIRPKASRCSNVFIRSEPLNHSEPVVGPAPIRGNDSGGSLVEPNYISPFVTSTQGDPSNFILDFEMDDKFLSEFLNPDFPTLRDGDGNGDDIISSYIPNSEENQFSAGSDLLETDFFNDMLII
ncbi:hypothetical protein Vadar_021206 [Vaccinium darrowii]|uniref:Uncharacterized protein n=1 Tax=Vaccinium darrowii TaxID=229202 RepID=A0ACB7YX86_9ERIC|nr:hypothetical protein Vadar_021206 [Vaccinium darrowii]